MNNYDGYTESQAMTDARIARRAEWNEQVAIRDEMVAECQPMLLTLLDTFQYIDEVPAPVDSETIDLFYWLSDGANLPEPAQLVNSTTNCRTPYVIDDDAARHASD